MNVVRTVASHELIPADSVKNRILTATGVAVEPVCYSAGYTEDNGEQQAPYKADTEAWKQIELEKKLRNAILSGDKRNSNDGKHNYRH